MELLTAQQAAVTWLRQAIAAGRAGAGRPHRPGRRRGRAIGVVADPGPRGPARARVRGPRDLRGPQGLRGHRARPTPRLEEIYHLRAPARARRRRARAAARHRRRHRRARGGGRRLPRGGGRRRRHRRARGQPPLPLPALRPGRIRAAAAPDPAAVGRHRGVPGDLLRHARRRGRRRPRAPRRSSPPPARGDVAALRRRARAPTASARSRCCTGCWRGSIALHAHPSSDHVRGQRAAPGGGGRARRPAARRGPARDRGGRRLPLRPALDARPRSTPLPVVLGHEGCGIVESSATASPPCSRATAACFILRPNCGRCDYCTVGRPMLCDGRTNPDGTLFDGTTRLRRLNGDVVHHYGRISCFAEHAVMPEEQLLVCRRRHPAGPRRAGRLRRHHRLRRGHEHRARSRSAPTSP